MRGRKPKPTLLKLVQGNRGKRSPKSTEPNPPPVAPPVPEHLSDEAKVEWGRMLAHLEPLGLVSQLYRAALAGYCQAWADWVEACRHCAKGKIVATPKKKITKRDGTVEESGGYPITNPWLAIRKQASKEMRDYGAEFGYSPASITRVSVEPPPGDDGGWGGIGNG